MPIQTFSIKNFFSIADKLAGIDEGLAMIIRDHGFPPMWQRPNTFETLVHFILEQQVSLASALAALTRLREKLTLISVENILTLTDEEMRACYVSRQKMGYIRGMAKAIADGSLDLASLETMQDEDVKAKLVQLKGVGNWTAEVYMMFVLQRAD
ncbi:MAG: DNA-3-methyladenine glycosylase 2 family protein, partial [Flavitalea sp.]